MFDEKTWNDNQWIKSEIVQEHFHMTFKECFKVFGFNRQVEWNKAPLHGQRIITYFRKYK